MIHSAKKDFFPRVQLQVENSMVVLTSLFKLLTNQKDTYLKGRKLQSST